jgi:chlorobactene glucosyltransferase
VRGRLSTGARAAGGAGDFPLRCVRMSELAHFYHMAVLLILLVTLGAVVVNLACFDGLKPARPGAEAPLVSILVPARNEAHNIAPCVRSLLAQDYPFCELLVLDDHSGDGTAEIVRGLGVSERGSVARLLQGQPLPDGWTGKNWACHQLSREARGIYLWFTDADTEHAPGTVSALVAYAERRRADLVSAWPQLRTETWSEKAVLPMILLLGVSLYPHWLLLLLQRFPRIAARLPRRVRRGLGAANGQSLFFRRAAYELIGGHAALRSHVVEDVGLGREVATRIGDGLRLFNCDALGFSTCRMYRSFAELWEGFSKNVRAAFEDQLGAFLAVGAVQVSCFLLPFVWIFFSRETGLVAAQIALIYAVRGLLTWRFRTSWPGWAMHPVGHALSLAIGLNSWRLSAASGVRWKGRTYRIAPLPER